MRKRFLGLTLCCFISMYTLFINTTTSNAVSKEYVSNITKRTNVEYIASERNSEDKIKNYAYKYYENFMEIILYAVNLKI